MTNPIKTARLSHHLTQAELANKIGVTQQHVQRLESDKGKPSVVIAKKIGEVLELDWTTLV